MIAFPFMLSQLIVFREHSGGYDGVEKTLDGPACARHLAHPGDTRHGGAYRVMGIRFSRLVLRHLPHVGLDIGQEVGGDLASIAMVPQKEALRHGWLFHKGRFIKCEGIEKAPPA
jgi:hypothetical protein